MDTRQWLSELETELFQRRLPRRYVTRLVRELSDHVLDDRERVMSTDAPMLPGAVERLGLPQHVAEAAEIAFRRRRFAARHPIWTFGVFPPLLLLVLAMAFFAIPLTIVDEIVDTPLLQSLEYSPWAPLLGRSYLIGCIVMASTLVVVAFAGLASRCDLRRRWPITTAITAAVLCGCLWTNATPKTPEKMGTVTIGIPSSRRMPTMTLPQVIQFAAPLAVAIWVTRRRSFEVRQPLESRKAA